MIHTLEIINYISQKNKGLMFLDAPTMSGKTQIIKKLHKSLKESYIITGENFYQILIDSCKQNTDTLSAYQNFSSFKFIFIEDFDFYGGRPTTERVFAKILTHFSEHAVVVATGINLKRKMPNMFEKLTKYEFFYKESNEWKKENYYA